MKIHTLITEGVLTASNRVYKPGSLQILKEYLQQYIDARTCFVAYSNVYDLNVLFSDKAVTDSYCGIVKEFDIENGQDIIDIELLDTPTGKLLQFMNTTDYRIDFPLQVNPVDYELSEDGSTIMDLTQGFTLKPILILSKGTGL